ncbi:MAG: hypothetical protein JSU63_20700 [Phycisphaerales bacterium]|nr:MAG: hypothetical protein JSU63_20700 [Phycisphaerales bacterium]
MTLVDRPIEHPEQDRLGHNELAERIAKHIQMFPPDYADMIGIFGSWGSGKSGLLNLVHGKLDETFKWISFDALGQPDGVVLLPLLYKLARDDKIAKKTLPHVARRLAFLGAEKLVERLHSRTLKEVKITLDGLRDSDGTMPESPNDALRTWFEKLVARVTAGAIRRVVVAVDNLDRCRPEVAQRAIETIQAVRECPSCTFLLAVDHRILEGYTKETSRGSVHDGPRWLEKMLPESFAIPQPRAREAYSEEPTSGDAVLAYIRDLLKEPECQTIRSHERVLWSAISAASILRNPRYMKGLIRRCCRIEDTVDPETFEYMVILIILGDLWPRAAELLWTVNQTDWEDYVSGSSPGASEDHELLEFVQGMGATGCIYHADKLRAYLDHVARLGLL